MASVNSIGNSIITELKRDSSIKGSENGFQETLSSMISQVDAQMKEADKLAAEFALGKTDSLHEVMIATEKSGISFSFLLQIRTKILEAYQEIMRMSF